MKKVHLLYFHVVGMGNYGHPRGLPQDSYYKLEHDVGNRFDVNALKLCDKNTGQTVGYVKRAHARLLRPIFRDKLAHQGSVLIKIKGPLKVIQRKLTHLSGVAFYVDEDKIQSVQILYGDTGLILEWYDSLTATYPQFVSTQDIGVTYEGRPERLLKLSTGGTGKWAIFIEGGMHAREWISPATVIYITDKLIHDYVNNADWFFNNYDVYILAVGNPDGYEFCWTDERLWRKNRNPNAGSSCIGTDLNRNWAFQWGGVGGDLDPCSNTYRGATAESELEIQNVVNFIMPQADQFILYMAYHSWGQQFFTRWDYTEDDVPLDHDELEDLAWRAADAITAVNGVYHEAGRAPVIMYAFSGSSADWARGVPDIKYPFLEELRDNGTYSFVLPPEQIIPTGEENWAGFQVLLNEIQLKCEGVLPPGPCNL